MTISEWISIGALVISVLSLLLSLKVSKGEKRRGEYDKKIELYQKAKSIIEGHSNYCSSIQRFLQMDTSSKQPNAGEESIAKREIEKLFGKEIAKMFDSILSLCSTANEIDFDMGRLLDAIRESSPEEQNDLREVLMLEESYDLSPEQHKQNCDYLSKIHVRFAQPDPANGRSEYDYLELEAELSRISKQIRKEQENLEKEMWRRVNFN